MLTDSGALDLVARVVALLDGGDGDGVVATHELYADEPSSGFGYEDLARTTIRAIELAGVLLAGLNQVHPGSREVILSAAVSEVRSRLT